MAIKKQQSTIVVEEQKVSEILKLLEQKILHAAVLNGGFDRLMTEIDKIKESQSQTGAKVDSIHHAIYHPDEGLFARVKTVENFKEKIDTCVDLQHNVHDLLQYKEQQDKLNTKDELSKEVQTILLSEHVTSLKDLMDYKTKVNNVFKWILVTLVGASVTLLFKIIYGFVQGHIVIH